MRKWLRMFIFLAILACPLCGQPAEAGLVSYGPYGRERVAIDDSSVNMLGKGHANVLISERRGKHDPVGPWYPVEILWGPGCAGYRLNTNGDRIGKLPDDLTLAVSNYMSENF